MSKQEYSSRWNTNYTSFEVASFARKDAIFLQFAHAFLWKRHDKYIVISYAFVSAHVKYGVWIKAGLQPFFPAEPGEKKSSRSELIQTPYFTWT